jgi:hypothetical protein
MLGFNELYTQSIKKYLFDVLKDKYPQDDSIIERIAKSLVTEKDINDFNQLVISIYTAGFLEATKQYKEQAEKIGYKISISVPVTEQKQSIFK